MKQKEFRIKGKVVFATSYNRVVIGGQGPYIELEKSSIVVPLEVTKGQEYRFLQRYSNCKYYWYNPEGHPTVKVYKQKGTVSYADYKIGKFYVDPDHLDWDGTDLYAEEGSKPNEARPTTWNRKA